MATTRSVPSQPQSARTKGPVEIAVAIAFWIIFSAITSWVIGIATEIVGTNTVWKGQGVGHARALVQDDLGHIQAAPRSLIVRDTVAMSEWIVATVQKPYETFGVLSWYQNLRSPMPAAAVVSPQIHKRTGLIPNLGKSSKSLQVLLSEWFVISMFVAQDTLLRMAVAVFALPAFVLACLAGVVDGLVRRDKRRWGGGRESSFIYHHSKRYTGWALTGGFTLYLAWPFGGFNPAYMVLVFTALVAFTMSTTVASFKKYV